MGSALLAEGWLSHPICREVNPPTDRSSKASWLRADVGWTLGKGRTVTWNSLARAILQGE